MSNGYTNVLTRPSNPKVRPENPKESTLIQNLIIASSLFCIVAMTFYNKTVESQPDSLKQYSTVSTSMAPAMVDAERAEVAPPAPKMQWFFKKEVAEAKSPVRFEFDQLSPKVAYTLDFGDGQQTVVTEKERQVFHTYQREGNYQVKLTGVHKNVSQQLQSMTIQVVDPIEIGEVANAVDSRNGN